MMESPTAETDPANGTVAGAVVGEEAAGDELDDPAPGGVERGGTALVDVPEVVEVVEAVEDPEAVEDRGVVAGEVTADAEWAGLERWINARAKRPSRSARSSAPMARSIRLILPMLTSVTCSDG